MNMKIVDLHYMESVYNNKNNVSDIIANLRYPQKYVTLEYDGVLYNLDVVSVDDYEFIVKIVDKVDASGYK